MKRRTVVLLMAGWVGLAVGCANPGWRTSSLNNTTIIKVGGAKGADVKGYFVQNGQRTDFAGRLPMGFTEAGLSEFVVRKMNPRDNLELVAQNDNQGWHAEVNSAAVPGVAALRLHVHRGLWVEKSAVSQF